MALALAPMVSGQGALVLKVVDSKFDPLYGAHVRVYSDTN